MKMRRLLSAAEVVELQQTLERRLETVGLPSQPEVAIKLLEISRDPRAQLSDYGKVIRNDQAIAGRVLRLANSAFFAQRAAVTTIDRACVVLGTERLKAVSLGFTLSRAAQVPGEEEYSRRVWGESLFRACLASELARTVVPSLVSEAFVVGLMMDAGLPLMPKLAGNKFRAIRDAGGSPFKVFLAQSNDLEFTHVDVIAALAKKWKFPELLSKPLEWRFTKPAEGTREEPVQKLHRVAYVVGALDLKVSADGMVQQSSVRTTASASPRVLNMHDADMQKAVRKSFGEYALTIEMFRDIAVAMQNSETFMDEVALNLTQAVDNLVEQDLGAVAPGKPTRFSLAGRDVEITTESNGVGVVYVYDDKGTRLLSHRFKVADADVIDIFESLGMENVSMSDLAALKASISKLAA